MGRRGSERRTMWERAASALPVTALLLTAVAAAGCNWTTFADEASKAPVRSIGAPNGFKSGDFGRSLLPLGDGQGHAAAFVATSINETNIAIVHVDTAGGVTSALVPKTALDSTEESEVTSLAEVAGATPPRLLLGTPKIHNQGYGRVYTYSLEEKLEQGASFASPQTEDETPAAVLAVAVGKELKALEAEDRFVLASWYLDQRTLAQIGRQLGVHESTVSRRLDRLTQMLRKRIRKRLQAIGWSPRQCDEHMAALDVRDVDINVSASLKQESPVESFPK